MTQGPAAVPSLPLSVTCSADAHFAETITALATRVTAGTGGGEGAARFAQAVTDGVAACMAHLGESRGPALTVELTASDEEWQGCLQWPADADADGAFASDLEHRLGGIADRVKGGQRGTDAFCTLACSLG